MNPPVDPLGRVPNLLSSHRCRPRAVGLAKGLGQQQGLLVRNQNRLVVPPPLRRQLDLETASTVGVITFSSRARMTIAPTLIP